MRLNRKVLFVWTVLLLGFFLGTFSSSVSAQNFSQADFEGTWDYIYSYFNYSTELLGVTTFDTSGSLTSGKLLTEGSPISSGSLSFTNTTSGTFEGTLEIEEPVITITINGSMNSEKNELSGDWSSTSGDWGYFYALKRPTGTQSFSLQDFQGKWNFSYYYTGDTSKYLGELFFNNNGELTSGKLITENITLIFGGATFYDWNNGNLVISSLFIYQGYYEAFTLYGTMDSDKKTISGIWDNTIGYSGTAIATKDTGTSTDGDGGGGGGGCFIATACFGTPMANEVITLRQFRDECLLTNPVGKFFVETYYKTSPPVADFIRQHPVLKKTARSALKPLIWISREITK